MKHVPGSLRADRGSEVRAPTRRAIAKQQTRVKVLAAARKLFSESGYEGATIRDIATAAGMSTGAVFANFADKSELFREIMLVDLVVLSERMRQSAIKGRTVDDALVRAFSAGYAFYKSQMPLARAAFSNSWSAEQGQDLRGLAPVQLLYDVITEQLQRGVERGELSLEPEIKLRTQMLFDCYLSNYPDAIFQGWSLDALEARSRDQIRIILAGARRG